MGNTHGPMATSTRVNFTTARKMDKDTGRKVVAPTRTSIKETTPKIESTDMENSPGAQAASTKDNTRTTSRRATARCSGSMAAYIEDFGATEFKQG